MPPTRPFRRRFAGSTMSNWRTGWTAGTRRQPKRSSATTWSRPISRAPSSASQTRNWPRLRLVPPECAPPGRSQQSAGTSRKRGQFLVWLAELGAREIGLLQVVADDLFGCLRVPAVQPVRQLLMVLPANLLRNGLVGGIANQDVSEAKHVVLAGTGGLRHHHLLSHERHQRSGQRRQELRRRESAHGSA